MYEHIPSGGSNQPVFVLRVRAASKPGAIKAYVDIQYAHATVHGIAVIENKTGGHFVGLPSNLGTGGKRFPIVEFSEPTRSAIAKIVLDAADEFLNNTVPARTIDGTKSGGNVLTRSHDHRPIPAAVESPGREEKNGSVRSSSRN
jgi:DNA-binding cell septation regulator SpoVG